MVMDTDLDPPMLDNLDPIQRTELSLPFCRSLIKTYVKHIRNAEKAAGGEGFVTIETLIEEFTSPAWAALMERNSQLCKMLLSDAFKNPSKNQSDSQIDADYLIIFGIIHCNGNLTDKADEWYSILQEGGKEAHEFLASNDKDLAPCFQKMCEFVTKDAFTEFARINGLERKYGKSDLDNISKDAIEILREDGYLDDVFGALSRLEYEPWVTATVNNAPYMFSAPALRRKILEQANLDFRY